MEAKYKEWCKLTKRNGSVLVGSSIKEFFIWLEDHDYYLAKYPQYSDQFLKSIDSIEKALSNRK